MIKVKEIVQTRFFKDSSYMIFGTLVMQLIAISTMPVLTRLYEPSFFGLLSSYTALLAVFSIVLTLRLESAIMLPKLMKSKNLIYLSSIFNSFLIFSILIALYFFLRLMGYDILYMVFDRTDLALILSVFLGILLMALTNINQAQLVNLKKFKIVAFSKLILPFSFFLFALFFYYVGKNYWNLIVAQLLAYSFLFIFLQKNCIIPKDGFNIKVYKNIIIEYADIVKYSSLNSILNAVSLNVPSLILLSLFGAETLGFYAISSKMVSIPTQLLSSSFSQVFYQKSVDIYNTSPASFYPFVKKIMIMLLFVGLITFSFVYLMIPIVVPFFLGINWIGAIEIMQYLCLWQVLMFVNGPVSSITILLRKQKEMLIFQLLLLLFRVLSIWYIYYLGLDAKYSILSFSLVGIVFNIFLFFYFLHISRNAKI